MASNAVYSNAAYDAPSTAPGHATGGGKGAAAPARAGGVDLAKLQRILDRFEITIAEANDLVVLQDYQVVIIADDSGSMLNSAEPSAARQLGAAPRTRWDELQETVKEIVDIASCLDETGVDVHFLNRSAVPAVKDTKDPRFVSAFATGPAGGTPLTEALQRVAQQSCQGGEKKVLLFVLTDGEPNGGPARFMAALQELVSGQVAGVRHLKVQIMACSGEDDDIAWMDKLDRAHKTVDVTDDFFTERQQVLRTGLAKKFTRGDWCLKAMLGPVSEKFDSWDEKLGKLNNPVGGCGNCAVS